MKTIEARGMHYRELNNLIRKYYQNGIKKFLLKGVNGQRYIGSGIKGSPHLTIEGTPGNDLAAFSSGISIAIKGNAQDAVGNTMNDGKIVIHGHAGDAVGHSMRGGRIYIKSYAGYRVGIHMKEYQDQIPVIIIGGKAGDFLGEYMAGGVIILLGLDVEKDEELLGSYCGTGMHGGVMYIRGNIPSCKLAKEVKTASTTEEDLDFLKDCLSDYCSIMNLDLNKVMAKPFTKLYPYNKRPYGKLYAY